MFKLKRENNSFLKDDELITALLLVPDNKPNKEHRLKCAIKIQNYHWKWKRKQNNSSMENSENFYHSFVTCSNLVTWLFCLVIQQPLKMDLYFWLPWLWSNFNKKLAFFIIILKSQIHTRICIIIHISPYCCIVVFFSFSFPLEKFNQISKIICEFYHGHRRSHFNTVLDIGISVSYILTQASCQNQLLPLSTQDSHPILRPGRLLRAHWTHTGHYLL